MGVKIASENSKGINEMEFWDMAEIEFAIEQAILDGDFSELERLESAKAALAKYNESSLRGL